MHLGRSNTNVCFVDDTWHDDDLTAVYWDLRKIANDYAANMRWSGMSARWE